MAELSDVQLVNFCNEYLRPLADSLTRTDAQLPIIIGQYDERGLGTIINDGGAANLIADGSEVDGRTRRAGGDVYTFINLVHDLETFFTPERRNVLHGWQVNGLPTNR